MRKCGICFVLFTCLFAVGRAVAAEPSLPTQPVRFVIGFSPGGGFDVTARAIARAAEKKGVVMAVTNISGAGGRRAVLYTGRSKPDGQTIVLANMPMQLFYNILKKDPVELTEFSWIAQAVTTDGLIAVKQDSKIKSIKDLEALDRFRLCVGGLAGHDGLLTVVLRDALELKNPQLVSGYYSAQAVPGLIKGECDVALGVANAIWTQGVKSGDVRLLAMSAPKRNPTFPTTPTLAELGYPELGSPALVNHGLIAAPPGTPSPVVRMLEGVILDALKDPEAIKVIESGGVGVDPLGADKTRALVLEMKGLVNRYGPLIEPYVR